jgi:superfamily I DNA/RNA helicase
MPDSPQKLIQLTPEQERILSHAPNRSARIIAFAGTGKTTTLAQYAESWSTPSLFLAFNAHIAKGAMKSLPQITSPQTLHSLAYQQLNIRSLGQRLHSNFDQKLLEHYAKKHSIPTGFEPTLWYQHLLYILKNYLESDQTDIIGKTPVNQDHHGMPELLRQAADIADELINYHRHDKPVCHDQYLKRFQFVGTIPDEFRYIMIDEAQDLNPVIIQILKQSDRPVIIVGDPWQSIYRYRGSINALDSFEGLATYYLSQSFRFGSDLARISNQILKSCAHPPEHQLRGNPMTHTEIIPYTDLPDDPITIIGRTNKKLKETIIARNQPYSLHGKILNLNEGINSAKDEHQDSSTDAWLHAHQHRASPTISHFTTCHGSKGLEWSTVAILDDFESGNGKSRLTLSNIRQEEIHLLYVAVTRAKHKLYLPASFLTAILRD